MADVDIWRVRAQPLMRAIAAAEEDGEFQRSVHGPGHADRCC